MNFLRRFWSYFSECWYAMKYSYLLSVRDGQIRELNTMLDVERRRRQQLERILLDTIHDNKDSGRLSQCVLRDEP